MKTLKACSLIIFIILVITGVFVAGLGIGYQRCSEDSIQEFQNVFEQGIEKGYFKGFEDGANFRTKMSGKI